MLNSLGSITLIIRARLSICAIGILGLVLVGCQAGASTPPPAPTATQRAGVPSPANPGAASPATPKLGQTPTTPTPLTSRTTPLGSPGLTSLATPTPGGTAAAPLAGATGRIIYARDGGLYSLEPASATFKQLATIPARTYVGAPALSPDGARLAYSLYDLQRATDKRDNGTDLYLMTGAGTDPKLLLEHDAVGVWLSEPAWTPDGKSLLYTRRDARGQESIERIGVDGTGRKMVIQDAASPTIAADGQAVVYLVTDPQAYTQSLWRAAPDGASPRRLLGDPEFEALVSPRLAPDGQQIAFIAVGGPKDIMPPRKAAGPDWNPLPWLAPPTADAHGVPYNIWTVKLDGSGLRRLTLDLEVELPMLVWSPDGKWIAFTSDKGLEVVSADGGERRFLGQDFAVGGLDWAR